MALNNGFTALVSVGGTDLPDPSEYEANTATIVTSARGADGYLIGTVLRNDVAKITLTWKFISVADWASILQMFNTSSTFIRSVTFFNQTTGAWTTRDMYVSDRNAKIFKRDTSGNVIGYLNAKLSLIEK